MGILIGVIIYLIIGIISYSFVRKKSDPIDIIITTILFWPTLALLVGLSIIHILYLNGKVKK